MEDSWFTDDLLGDAYKDPVMAEDGFIYERSFIETWFKTGSTKSPKTLLPIGTSLFYPFEYYQARSVWAKAKGLPDPKKPEQYGLIGGTRPVPTPNRHWDDRWAPTPNRHWDDRWVVAQAPVRSVNYFYDLDDDEEGYISQEEYPPLPRPSPPTRPPEVRAARRH
jgi:hypothetical protein